MAHPKEVLRRLYHELVERRSRVRIVPSRAVELDEPPIFVLGVYGSGTTLLRYVLDSHPRICCGPESDFVLALAPLLEDPIHSQGLAALGADEESVVAMVRELCVQVFGNYAASWNKPRWADKTPAYASHPELLERLFPEAQFVHLHRRGFDQAHSFTRGGTFARPVLEPFARPDEDLRLASLRYWSERSLALLDFERATASRSLRLRYEDLCAEPKARLRELFAFLGEPWDPAVLEFWKAPHDKGHEHGRVVATRGFEPRGGYFETWPEALRRAAVPIARPALEALGYTSPVAP